MTALYAMATTQLVALLFALDVLWREYHPARVTQLPSVGSLDEADTLVHDTEPISAAELVLSFFKVIDDDGRPKVVWAA